MYVSFKGKDASPQKQQKVAEECNPSHIICHRLKLHTQSSVFLFLQMMPSEFIASGKDKGSQWCPKQNCY